MRKPLLRSIVSRRVTEEYDPTSPRLTSSSNRPKLSSSVVAVKPPSRHNRHHQSPSLLFKAVREAERDSLKRPPPAKLDISPEHEHHSVSRKRKYNNPEADEADGKYVPRKLIIRKSIKERLGERKSWKGLL